ncbi:MAG: cytochrome ubiquinol oxidase subunit I [Endomicrobia bacterium]|nr:cytochrome ubiquinol oxidase subunit I [Endomicrobiia bacterium]
MDVLFLSRIQFALTAGFHFLFVPMTLGVVVLIAIMQTFWYKTGDEVWLKLVKFFGKLFLINFAVGVVTGISLEFQFGMNWAEYSRYVGDIFGVPLAIEATVAFFLESVFLGLWIFGWDRVSKKIHLFSIWMVALGSNFSALWILFANAFMQYPVGYEIVNNRVELVDFWAFITSRYGWVKFFHTIFSSYIVGAFFVMAVSSYFIIRGKYMEIFKRSFKLASYLALISSFGSILFGDFHAKDIYKFQPTKFAAMESIWETQKKAPYIVFSFPDVKNEKNYFEFIKIPYALSFLADYNINSEIKGLKDFKPEDRPPIVLSFLSFKFMVLFGFYLALFSIIASYISYKNLIYNYPKFLKITLYSLPIPYITCQLGWILAEVGRQPWAVYGLLKTKDAISKNLSFSDVFFTLSVYFIVYSIIGIFAVVLMVKHIKKGIENA